MKTCEDCRWYEFRDSAYGACLRFPPQRFQYLKPTFMGKKIITGYTYPIIPFDNQKCGEFKEPT